MGNFYTDVIQRDPRFNSVARINDLALLEPVTRGHVQQIIDSAAKNGIRLMVFETYRSQARQTALFKQNKSQLETVGVHHYGLACDLVRDLDGEPSWEGDFKFLGDLARKNGMIWGGDWGRPEIKHKFVDDDHVQRCTVARQDSLFSGEWYPDGNYNPYA